MPTWIDTLEARRAAAAEPKTPEELRPDPAVQVAGPSHEDVVALVRDEVGAQMEGFMSRLEGLFSPHLTVTAAGAAPEAPAAPVIASAVENPPAAPGGAQGGSEPA